MPFYVDIDNHWTESHLSIALNWTLLSLRNILTDLNNLNFVMSGILGKNYQIVTFWRIVHHLFYLHFKINFPPLKLFFMDWTKLRCRSKDIYFIKISQSILRINYKIRSILISVIMSNLIRYLNLKGRKRISSSKIINIKCLLD